MTKPNDFAPPGDASADLASGDLAPTGDASGDLAPRGDASADHASSRPPRGDALVIAGRGFSSRLIVGTGKFSSHEVMRAALYASGTEMVTVALRRVDLDSDDGQDLLDYIDPERYLLLPNTSGAVDADEAVRLARLARAAGLSTWVKLEVTPDPRYMLPDPVETLRAAETLVTEGFTVLPYMGADPVLAKRLEEVGCATVMPLGSWIGSNRGLRTSDALEIIVEQATVPVVVDAGLGVPSHGAAALEMGCDAVLVNTAIAVAEDPVAMADAFRLAVRAGRRAYLAGAAGERPGAEASSPLTGFIGDVPDEDDRLAVLALESEAERALRTPTVRNPGRRA